MAEHTEERGSGSGTAAAWAGAIVNLLVVCVALWSANQGIRIANQANKIAGQAFQMQVFEQSRPRVIFELGQGSGQGDQFVMPVTLHNIGNSAARKLRFGKVFTPDKHFSVPYEPDTSDVFAFLDPGEQRRTEWPGVFSAFEQPLYLHRYVMYEYSPVWPVAGDSCTTYFRLETSLIRREPQGLREVTIGSDEICLHRSVSVCSLRLEHPRYWVSGVK